MTGWEHLPREKVISRSLRPCSDRPPLRLRIGQDLLELRQRGLRDDDRPPADAPPAHVLQEPVHLPLIPLPASPADRGVPVQLTGQPHLLRRVEMGQVEADDTDGAQPQVVEGDTERAARQGYPLPQNGVQELAVQAIDVVRREQDRGDVHIEGALDVVDRFSQSGDGPAGDEDENIDVAVGSRGSTCNGAVENCGLHVSLALEEMPQRIDGPVDVLRVHFSTSKHSRSTVSKACTASARSFSVHFPPYTNLDRKSPCRSLKARQTRFERSPRMTGFLSSSLRTFWCLLMCCPRFAAQESIRWYAARNSSSTRPGGFASGRSAISLKARY